MTPISAIPPSVGVTPALPVRAAAAQASDAGAQILQALQSLDDLIPPGSTATAEVLATRPAGQNFQFLLQLQLAQGGSVLLTTQSPTNNLPVGSQLLVSTLGSTQLAVLLQSLEGDAPPPPLQQLDLRQLPVGTTLQLRVLSSLLQQQPGAAPTYEVIAKALSSNLEGRQLKLESARPVPVGSLLTVVIKDRQEVTVLPMAQRLDQLDIDRQLQGQGQRQLSMSALLQWLEDVPEAELPPSVGAALKALLANLEHTEALTTAQGWTRALARSGLQLEQQLLERGGPDLQEDFKANLLRLVDRLLASVPGDALRNPQVAAQAAQQNLPDALRRALGGAATASRQPTALDFPLGERDGRGLSAANAELDELLQLATGVIARLQTHQLASLAQTQVLPDGYYLSTWQTEIPWRDGERLGAVQVRFQEERPPPDTRGEARDSLWKVELAFDLAPLGPLQVRAQLASGRLSSEFWAEKGATATLIDTELPHLRDRLLAAGFVVGDLSSRQGRPARHPRTSLEQRWIDDTA
ncbi:flagellar hook-length control protein FliK [Pseudomonas benzopyrenica]|uniref:flagellar hook-length control protein FliK n=1 Tax=Pseudomonas benzopyrenica TaxID=2993566 RepID=UPI003F1586E8